MGNQDRIQVSQASVSRCIHQVTGLICDKLMPTWVEFRVDRHSLSIIKAGFQRKFNFPGVIGCIDCTHVKIIGPTNTEDAPAFVYVNRHGNYTVNVQLVMNFVD